LTVRGQISGLPGAGYLTGNRLRRLSRYVYEHQMVLTGTGEDFVLYDETTAGRWSYCSRDTAVAGQLTTSTVASTASQIACSRQASYLPAVSSNLSQILHAFCCALLSNKCLKTLNLMTIHKSLFRQVAVKRQRQTEKS